MNPIPDTVMGQKPFTGQAICLRGEPNTIVLMNGHSMKPILMTYHYTSQTKCLRIKIRNYQSTPSKSENLELKVKMYKLAKCIYN